MADRAPINPVTGHPSQAKRRKVPHWPWLIGGLLILLQGCVTTPSVSPEDEARSQAKISYLLGDYQHTLAIVLPRAEAGEAWAQYTLGYMYYYGHGLTANKETAKRWIESAAAKNYAPAQQALQRLSATPPTQTGINAKTIVPGAADNGATSLPPSDNDNHTKPALTAPPSIPTQQAPTAASTAKPEQPAAPPKAQTTPSTPPDPQLQAP